MNRTATSQIRPIKGLSIVNGQYSKKVGNTQTRSGSISRRRWYFGTDPTEAKAQAAVLKAKWERGEGVKIIEAGGVPISVWDETSSNPPAPPTMNGNATGTTLVATSPVANTLTLNDAAKLYTDYLARRQTERGKNPAHGINQRHRLTRAIKLIDGNILMADLDRAKVAQVVVALCQRPHATPNHGQTKKGTRWTTRKASDRIAIITARSYIKVWRWFLLWAADEGIWARPLKFDAIFRENKPVDTAADKKARLLARRAGGISSRFFTLDELAELYVAAPERQRLWILLSLNAGFANMELASLKRFEIVDLDSDHPYIARERQKTGVYAEWPLWDETAKALRKFMVKDRSDELALATGHGSPLIEPTANGRRDAVRSGWLWVYRMGKVYTRYLPFKHLRKTAANWIRQEAGAGMASMFLGHGDKGEDDNGMSDDQLSAYTERDWKRLADEVMKLRAKLQPLFDYAAQSESQRRETRAARKTAKQQGQTGDIVPQPIMNIAVA